MSAGVVAMELTCGTRVRAEWREASLDSLAGVQMKTAAVARAVEGTVTAIRGNSPTASTSADVWIETDDGDTIVVNADHIVAVFE